MGTCTRHSSNSCIWTWPLVVASRATVLLFGSTDKLPATCKTVGTSQHFGYTSELHEQQGALESKDQIKGRAMEVALALGCNHLSLFRDNQWACLNSNGNLRGDRFWVCIQASATIWFTIKPWILGRMLWPSELRWSKKNVRYSKCLSSRTGRVAVNDIVPK